MAQRRIRSTVGASALALALVLAPVLAGCSSNPRPSPGQTPAVVPVIPVVPVDPTGIPGAWKTTLNDGPTQLAQWGGWFGGGLTGPVNTNENACYSSDHVGMTPFTLTGQRNLTLTLTGDRNTCSGTTYPYTGALISSRGIFQQTYGAFEAKVYIPAAPDGSIADWPAVWSDGMNQPQDGEIDAMEGLLGVACYHTHPPTDGPGECVPLSTFKPGWNIVGWVWQPGSVTFYYNGVQVGRIDGHVPSTPNYLILDLTNGPGVGGKTVVPATMEVAYVRAWTSLGSSGGTGG